LASAYYNLAFIYRRAEQRTKAEKALQSACGWKSRWPASSTVVDHQKLLASTQTSLPASTRK